MKKITQLLILGILAFGLAACGTTGSTGGDTTTGGTGGDSGVSGRSLDKDLLSRKLIHFEYNSAEIDDESRRIIEAHANHLNGKSIRIRLEGHADERGTREYNLSLGERRANAVAKIMRALGVEGSRIKKVSFGEEKPLRKGHNEAAWSMNRRVEIAY
ncbi:MAG TPA: peptidoglycan-associated lipoprotein Pal [Acidiferrobacteraceae bacterium]|jgi:peptidoglycan-associated lipoprotein|nr:peptidoglycan-associated lipoprotein Pal [Acidiferrobacteraceae bacterium]HEX20154.1 peptidoglycan-associated lipoprotein Pal [Acidiferrobacteraceae bacterium]